MKNIKFIAGTIKVLTCKLVCHLGEKSKRTPLHMSKFPVTFNIMPNLLRTSGVTVIILTRWCIQDLTMSDDHSPRYFTLVALKVQQLFSESLDQEYNS